MAAAIITNFIMITSGPSSLPEREAKPASAPSRQMRKNKGKQSCLETAWLFALIGAAVGSISKHKTKQKLKTNRWVFYPTPSFPSHWSCEKVPDLHGSSHSPLTLFQSAPQELCPSEQKATLSHCEPTVQSRTRRSRSPLSWPLSCSYCITIFF